MIFKVKKVSCQTISVLSITCPTCVKCSLYAIKTRSNKSLPRTSKHSYFPKTDLLQSYVAQPLNYAYHFRLCSKDKGGVNSFLTYGLQYELRTSSNSSMKFGMDLFSRIERVNWAKKEGDMFFWKSQKFTSRICACL